MQIHVLFSPNGKLKEIFSNDEEAIKARDFYNFEHQRLRLIEHQIAKRGWEAYIREDKNPRTRDEQWVDYCNNLNFVQVLSLLCDVGEDITHYDWNSYSPYRIQTFEVKEKSNAAI